VKPYYVRMTTSETEHATWVPTLTFAAKLALIRHKMGWNIKQAAIACGLPPQSWRGWELQGRLPHDIRATARRISMRTQCDYDWLLDEPTESDGLPRQQTIVGLLQSAERMNAKRRGPADNRPPGQPSVKSTNGVRRTARIPRDAIRRTA
jgi:hypothetical protein